MVFSCQPSFSDCFKTDLRRTLSELGLFDRQAMIVVPRQRTTDQSSSRNVADYSNASNEGYFAYAKRLFSFINPLSYLGGGSSSAIPRQQSQHGMWESSEFLFLVVVPKC